MKKHIFSLLFVSGILFGMEKNNNLDKSTHPKRVKVLSDQYIELNSWTKKEKTEEEDTIDEQYESKREKTSSNRTVKECLKAVVLYDAYISYVNGKAIYMNLI